jgi:hypothetical protein
MAAMISGNRARAALLAVALLVLAGCGGGADDSTVPSPSTPTTTPATPATTTATTPAGTQTTGGTTPGPQLGPAFDDIAGLPGALKSAPPWPANNDSATLQLRLRAIGLTPLTEEGQVVHIHQHLDVYVEGRKVTVPDGIGIAADRGFISDLHTHDATGIMHVESPTVQSFSLGQYFAVWGVPLSAKCIGSLCEKSAKGEACVGAACGGSSAKELRVWVDGAPVTADPTRIVLAEHQEIVIAYGTEAQIPDPLPKRFDFAAIGL